MTIDEIKVGMKDDATGARREYVFQDGKIRITKDGQEEVLDTKTTKLLCEQMNAMLAMALARL